MAHCVIFSHKEQLQVFYKEPPQVFYKEHPQALQRYNHAMRLFFGLPLGQQTCLDIDRWVTRSLPPMAHPVPLANFHITLVFLGNVDGGRLEQLNASADDVRCPKFELTLNEAGFWNKPSIFWLGWSETPQPLLTLSKKLKYIANQMGCSVEKKRYQPHVTLARRCALPPPAAIEAPCFPASFDHFSLYESVTTRSGMRYDVIETWPLVREKLDSRLCGNDER